MSYNNNFRNNNRGYSNNNRNNRNYNDNRRYENNDYRRNEPAFNGFDATKYKKPDIEIKGLTGKIYRISGNFSMGFGAEILKTIKRVEAITKGNMDNAEKFPEIYDLLKDWTLQLINLNVDGVTYSMDAVLRDFNDIYVMYNLIAYISGFMSTSGDKLEQKESE